MPVQTHQINLQGLSGGMFWASLAAILFATIGFSTCGWVHYSDTWTGLWSSYTSISRSIFANYGWFQGVQATATLGIIFLSFAFIFIILYNFVHNVSISKSLVLKLIVACCVITVISILVSVALFGVKAEGFKLHWSYAFFCIGGILTLFLLVLACVQMKRASII
ncbi:hypothetical protein HELRODRAFT_189177 [Helobdella robusta]|uniref:MARVEL domain-containing protein n=1 Tax=Helobdella robusta TaxID=6412 RepID=T1FQR3_HELRO|nr:hypothetical protein HELRODRAFT_189177 [Helobdella robusta]ESN96273.1 hypothetical protein HELRODRAFT_189177 [Helobdella robusta]